jgi:hypothetical protein
MSYYLGAGAEVGGMMHRSFASPPQNAKTGRSGASLRVTKGFRGAKVLADFEIG